jgi:uncharacterized peroxidase-related enzyme
MTSSTSRIAIPATIDDAPERSRALLKDVKAAFGVVPNLFRLVATSPAALQGLLGLHGALAHGQLGPALSEQIALAIAEINGCSYCLSAHSYLAKHVAKLGDADIDASRAGGARDERGNAAVQFAAELARARGHVGADAIAAVRRAGFSDAEIIEIIAHVALNTLTNYVNEALKTDIDFPIVTSRSAAA